jgi:hypothetical protein
MPMTRLFNTMYSTQVSPFLKNLSRRVICRMPYGQKWMHRNPPMRVNFKNLEDVMGEDVKHKS